MTGAQQDFVLAERRGQVLALRIGLVDHLIVDRNVLAAAVSYAQQLATQCSPTSMAVIKQQLQTDADGTYADSVSRAEGLMFDSFRGEDLVEGVQSHLDKRTPTFPSLPTRSSRVPVRHL